jgi:hypothetical protein
MSAAPGPGRLDTDRSPVPGPQASPPLSAG